jgi:uncharacterized SAM-binding protein YcdF (DUF218 family)
VFFERKKKSLWRRILKLPLYALVVWALGFFLFLVRLPVTDTQDDVTADAVVVLTGGANRLDTGVKLLAEQKAEKLLISGVHRDVMSSELVTLTGANPALFECCVTLDRQASNTLENAVETAKWVDETATRSIILVTSDYHIQRSVLLFRKSMPDVRIHAYPVKSKMAAFKLAKEYNKYLATLMLELVGY